MNYREAFENLKQADMAINLTKKMSDERINEVMKQEEFDIERYNDIKTKYYLYLRDELDKLKADNPQAYIQSAWGHADYNDKGELVVIYK